jgi:hypothetical protein
MSAHILSLGQIIILQDDIAEVIASEGIEIDVTMLQEYHTFLVENLKHPFALLINKKNAYTYTFETQQLLGKLNPINERALVNARAVVTYNNIAETTIKNLASMPREIPWNMKSFNDRQPALNWLKEQQQLLIK